MNSLLMQVFLYLTLAGALIILTGTVISMIPYRDRNGERYSMRNHFISELGEVGVSKEAWGFNTGMTIGGWLFLPLMLAPPTRLRPPLLRRRRLTGAALVLTTMGAAARGAGTRTILVVVRVAVLRFLAIGQAYYQSSTMAEQKRMYGRVGR